MQFLIIGVFVALIVVCILLNQKEGWYYTQAYYPYSYTGGFGREYPYYSKGYVGPGSYKYPGYTPERAEQMEKDCKLGCLGNAPFAKRGGRSPDCQQCLEACAAKNPYSMGV